MPISAKLVPTVDVEDFRPEPFKKLRVRVDADLLRRAREVLGAVRRFAL